jgi:hypothetical protein
MQVGKALRLLCVGRLGVFRGLSFPPPLHQSEHDQHEDAARDRDRHIIDMQRAEVK